MKRGGTVYILTNLHNQVFYTGVTSDLIKRIQEHKEKKYSNSFTATYQLDKLVYYESYLTIEEAIAEEKRIKAGNKNAEWKDLWEEINKW